MPQQQGDGIRLPIENKWAVYLISASKCKLSYKLSENLDEAPKALLTAAAPLEGCAEEDMLLPIYSALHQAAFPHQTVDPRTLHRAAIADLMPHINLELKNAPVFGVAAQDSSSALHNSYVRQVLQDKFNIPTVIYGSEQACEQALLEFSHSLHLMIGYLYEVLFVSKNKGKAMANDDENTGKSAEKAAQVASVINNYTFQDKVGAVGDNNTVAQNNAKHGQAAAGDIHNGANMQDVGSLLNAVLLELQATPAYASKLNYVAPRIEELKTLAAQNDDTPQAKNSAKRAIEDMDMVLDGVDKASKLYEHWQSAKEVVLANWTALAVMFASIAG